MEFRSANESDLERLVEIHRVAYPDARNGVTRQYNFTDNSFGRLDDLVVASDRGDIVGHAFLFPLRAFFGGVEVRVGGIASVGIAPEARGRGIATALIHHLHARSNRRGDALTMLYAFRQGFYARFGYATTSSRKRLAIDTRSVPAPWRALARSRVRGVRGGDRTALVRAHVRAAQRSSGWILRGESFWDRFLATERRILLVCERAGSLSKTKSKIDGYVAFTLVQTESHAETILEVDELVHDDDETRRALVGALSAMQDQAKEIVLEVSESDPIERVLMDADGRRSGTKLVEHRLGEIVGGPMVRIEDVAHAFSARGYFADGSFGVVVRSENTDAFDVRVRDGRAEIVRGRGVREPLSTTRAGLSAILYGGLSATNAVLLGLAEATPRVADRIDAIVRMPPLCPIDAF